MPNIKEDLLTSKIQNWWVDILTPKIKLFWHIIEFWNFLHSADENICGSYFPSISVFQNCFPLHYHTSKVKLIYFKTISHHLNIFQNSFPSHNHISKLLPLTLPYFETIYVINSTLKARSSFDLIPANMVQPQFSILMITSFKWSVLILTLTSLTLKILTNFY